jgi:membrane protein implicated in regulation of membrane protease activity
LFCELLIIPSLSTIIDKEGVVDDSGILSVVLVNVSDVIDVRFEFNGGVFVVISVVDVAVGSRTLRATTRRTC